MFDELNHALRLNGAGILEHAGLDGLNNRIAEWLATPMFTVADNPAWGHNLRPLWHDPESDFLAMQIEMAIVRKLPHDVRGIRIRRIGVTFTDLDRCLIEIYHDGGRFQGETTLGEEVGRAYR